MMPSRQVSALRGAATPAPRRSLRDSVSHFASRRERDRAPWHPRLVFGVAIFARRRASDTTLARETAMPRHGACILVVSAGPVGLTLADRPRADAVARNAVMCTLTLVGA